MGVVKHDWPEYDEEAPEVYKGAELTRLYAACDEEEERWFRFFELTGMREGEVQHCQWSLLTDAITLLALNPHQRAAKTLDSAIRSNAEDRTRECTIWHNWRSI
jgi:hypothetical protein